MSNEAPTMPEPIPRVADYEMLRCIGTGAFGDVWLARSKATGRFRAIKLICRDRFPKESYYETEFTGLKKFEEISREHAGFIDILHVTRDDHRRCFSYVMELADDVKDGQTFEPGRYVPKTLRNVLQEKADSAAGPGRLTPAECVEVALSLTAALSALHQLGLAHRDIKPSNIVFVRGLPKLADVGLVTDLREQPEETTLIGSPPYMDPDVHGTTLGDLFAFGRVLFVMATGRPPQECPYLPPDHPTDTEGLTVFRELISICRKACHPETSQRYHSAEEIHRELLVLRVGRSIRRLERLERMVENFKRFAVIGLVMATLAGLLLYQVFERRRQAAELRQNRVGSFVAYGNRALENKDALGALPWFAEALRQDYGNPRTEETHRLRLGMLLRQCPTITQMWFAHHTLNFAEFAGQENQVLLSAPDLRWAVHDLATGKPLYPAFGHGVGNDTVSISPAAGMAVTSSLGGTNDEVHVWNYLTGQEASTLSGGSAVRQAAISPDGKWVAAAAEPNLVLVWNTATRQRVGTLAGHAMSVLNLAFSSDGRRLVTSGSDSSAIVWDVEKGALLARFTNHASWVYSSCFSPDSRLVATASFDRCARIWDVESSREVLPPMRHGDGVHSVEFSSDGTRLVTAGLDFLVRVWDVRTGALLQQLRHNSKPLHAGFSPSGRQIVTACYDGTVRVWSPPSDATVPKPSVVVFSGDGARYASATNGSIQLRDVSGRSMLMSVSASNQQIRRILLNQNGTRFLTLSQPPSGASPAPGSLEACLWDVRTAGRIGLPVVMDLSSTNPVVSPDGRYLLGVARGRGTVWDLPSGRELFQLARPAQCGAFNASGTRLAAAMGTNVLVWDLSPDPVAPALTCPQPTWVGSVEWSLDGLHFVTACWDHSFNPEYARVYNGATGKPAGPPLNHRDGVRFATFSPKGDMVVTCGEDSIGTLWDWQTGRRLGPSLRHNGQVLFAVFSPDGRKVATVCRESTLRIWDTETCEPVTPELDHPQEIVSALWIQGGRGVLAQTQSGKSWWWSLAPDGRPLEKLVQIAELLSAEQIRADETAVPQTKEGIQKLWESLRSEYPASFAPSL